MAGTGADCTNHDHPDLGKTVLVGHLGNAMNDLEKHAEDFLR